jgi:hypothetical protein
MGIGRTNGQETNMKVAVLTVLLALASVPDSSADDAHLVTGLHCKTEAQVDAAIEAIHNGIPPLLAAELLNREEVACVFADQIQYMIEFPVMLGRSDHRGVSLIKYEGTLVGVLVGTNPRPIEPPLHLYFIVPEPLPGVAEASGA